MGKGDFTDCEEVRGTGGGVDTSQFTRVRVTWENWWVNPFLVLSEDSR